MEFEPQFWAQLGVVGVAFGWLLYVVTSRLERAMERMTRAIEQLGRQVSVNTLLVARVTGQNVDDLDRLLANGHGR